MHLHNSICASFRKWVNLMNELNEEGRRQNLTASTSLLLLTQVIPSTMFDVYLVCCRILWCHFLNDWWCKVYSNGSTLLLLFSDPLPILWRPPILTFLNFSSLCLSYREELCDLTELAETNICTEVCRTASMILYCIKRENSNMYSNP